MTTSAHTTSFGSNHSGSSQSSSLVNELKLDATTNLGAEETCSSPSSSSSRFRLRTNFVSERGVVADICGGSLVGKMVCLTLYPSATATRLALGEVAG